MAALASFRRRRRAGGALFGPVGAIAGRIAGALAGNVIDHALFGAGTTRQRRRAAARRPRCHGLDRRRADPARLWPRAARRPGDLGDASSRRWSPTADDSDGGGKGGRRRDDHDHQTYSYFANFAVGLCEGPIGRVGAHLGRRQAARSHRHHLSRLSRRRGPDAGSADRRQGRRRQRAGLSRPRLCGVRAAAAGQFRQPHSAAVVRGDAPGRRGSSGWCAR